MSDASVLSDPGGRSRGALAHAGVGHQEGESIFAGFADPGLARGAEAGTSGARGAAEHAGATSAAAGDGRYTYNPGDRRDPFVSLLGIGTEAGSGSNRIEGLGGMAVGDISVQGILQTSGIIISMVLGPDNKSYVVREGDKFLDGTVQSVTPEGLVIVQEVNDPLSLVKQRVIRKLLRSLEDVKQ